MMNFLIFEVIIVLIFVSIVSYMKFTGYNKTYTKSTFLFLTVLLFQIMSEPMWLNHKLNSWAFIYGNISWVLTLGWVSILLLTILLVDGKFKESSEKTKFWLYLTTATILTVIAESIILKLGIRSYAPVLSDTFSGILIPLTQVPVEVLLATPIITALVISFYKFMISQVK